MSSNGSSMFLLSLLDMEECHATENGKFAAIIPPCHEMSEDVFCNMAPLRCDTLLAIDEADTSFRTFSKRFECSLSNTGSVISRPALLWEYSRYIVLFGVGSFSIYIYKPFPR